MPPLTALAPAKINLFLHVGPVDADGYHPLSSLVAFAEVGDRVTVEPADRLSLSVSGPFGAGLAEFVAKGPHHLHEGFRCAQRRFAAIDGLHAVLAHGSTPFVSSNHAHTS